MIFFVIVLFTTFFWEWRRGQKISLLRFVNVPVSIFSWNPFGSGNWLCFVSFFETAYKHQKLRENSTKVILVLGVSFLLTAVEGWLDGKVAVSGLLAVVSMACVLKVKCIPAVSKRLSINRISWITPCRGRAAVPAAVRSFILVMTVEPGFGTSFLHSTMPKLHQPASGSDEQNPACARR